MIGPKKLSQIRAELRAAVQGASIDPLSQLEASLAGTKSAGDSCVVASLKRLLESPVKAPKARSKQRA